MNTSSHDFVTVDMRGLKAALVAHADARRTSTSAVVREAVASLLGCEAVAPTKTAPADPSAPRGRWVKLSVRLTRAEAARLKAAAKAADLSYGAYLAGLCGGVAVLLDDGARPSCIAALTSSCAELSTLSRNVHQLTELLKHGDVKRALEHRAMLDRLTLDVRDHLKLAASTLAALRPSPSVSCGAAAASTGGIEP